MFCVTVILFKLLLVIEGIQINYIKVPPAVQNNTDQSVILECNYSIRPDDSELVVKWYLNDAVVYQWIPPHKPQALGIMKDRVNLSYVSSDDPKMAYRSMQIINPTTNIAVPEKSLELFHSGHTNQKINFTCTATEVYPEPKLTVFKDKKDEFENRNYLQAVEWSTSRLPTGRYSVTITTSILLNKIAAGSLVHCELKIPGTGYVKRKSMLYYPPNMDNLGESIHYMQRHRKQLCLLLLTCLCFV